MYYRQNSVFDRTWNSSFLAPHFEGDQNLFEKLNGARLPQFFYANLNLPHSLFASPNFPHFPACTANHALPSIFICGVHLKANKVDSNLAHLFRR